MTVADSNTVKAKFEAMYDKVMELKVRYENRELHYEDLLIALQETYFQHEGFWWAVGFELGGFYYYDEKSHKWEIAKPPVDLREDIKIIDESQVPKYHFK